MVTSFGKILRKLCIDHLERLLDMAKKLDISVAFLSSVEIGKKSASVGMEEKVIELYTLDQEKASLLRKLAYACRKSFTDKSSNSFHSEIIGMPIKNNLESFSQQNLAELKDLAEKVGKKESSYRDRVQNPIPSLLFRRFLCRKIYAGSIN